MLDGGELLGGVFLLELGDEGLGSGVGPYDGVGERFAGGCVPDEGCLALVGNADGADAALRVSSGFEFVDGSIDAGFDGGDEVEGVVRVPSVYLVVCFLGSGCVIVEVRLTLGVDTAAETRPDATPRALLCS